MGAVHLIVCYYHATYDFQRESTLYSCLNVKELLAQNKRHIFNLSDSNGIRTYNHLVCKRTVKHLSKLQRPLLKSHFGMSKFAEASHE